MNEEWSSNAVILLFWRDSKSLKSQRESGVESNCEWERSEFFFLLLSLELLQMSWWLLLYTWAITNGSDTCHFLCAVDRLGCHHVEITCPFRTYLAKWAMRQCRCHAWRWWRSDAALKLYVCDKGAISHGQLVQYDWLLLKVYLCLWLLTDNHCRQSSFNDGFFDKKLLTVTETQRTDTCRQNIRLVFTTVVNHCARRCPLLHLLFVKWIRLFDTDHSE